MKDCLPFSYNFKLSSVRVKELRRTVVLVFVSFLFLSCCYEVKGFLPSHSGSVQRLSPSCISLLSLIPRTKQTMTVDAASSSPSWSDPNWNWGSAVGKGHDEAMKVRARLRMVSEREKWLQSCSRGEINREEMTLVFALRMQLAARQGKDGNGKGWEIMSLLADCAYEKVDGDCRLKEDLIGLSDKLSRDLTSIVQQGQASGEDSLGFACAMALAGSDFLKDGL